MLSYKFISIKSIPTSAHPFRQFRNLPFPCPFPPLTRYKSEFGGKCKCIQTNIPHPPRDPPENYNPTSFCHCAFRKPKNIQPLVFRPMETYEILGPNASKKKVYKNPEYFAYHRFSHVDLFMNAMRIRMEKRMQQMCPSSEKAEECQEENEDSDEDFEEENKKNSVEQKGDIKNDCKTHKKGK
ncbi:uncharacterized protein LOC129913374 [Episyrphus balteatus]|uniref:uncharacterized protein LOC129913374 n=1 Tax=Episyrphus balteatus TaxID=286459 RepID=UPI0024860D11|nr:uncharacterized protein LOC129913374 [Episyrphus balteatus]